MIHTSVVLNQTEDSYLECKGDETLLQHIYELIKITEVEEIAKTILNTNKTNNGTKFYINKQAAYNNKFHMLDEDMSPLGDIEVKIRTYDPDYIIDELTTKV